MANFAARLVGASDRDDVVQDSLLRAWRRWSTYEAERGSPRAWLLAVVAGEARRHWRRSRRPRHPVAIAPAAAPKDIDIERAIARLPLRQRLAIELHYLVDLSVADVASVMGCSQGTVKSTLWDARVRLRRELEEQWKT